MWSPRQVQILFWAGIVLLAATLVTFHMADIYVRAIELFGIPMNYNYYTPEDYLIDNYLDVKKPEELKVIDSEGKEVTRWTREPLTKMELFAATMLLLRVLGWIFDF